MEFKYLYQVQAEIYSSNGDGLSQETRQVSVISDDMEEAIKLASRYFSSLEEYELFEIVSANRENEVVVDFEEPELPETGILRNAPPPFVHCQSYGEKNYL